MTTAGETAVPVAVVIPTYERGDAVLRTLRRIFECRPLPAEVWVHIDAGDGRLEAVLAQEFPGIHVLSSTTRLGPGGGRDRCLRSCTTPYAVSFDDDSYPVDTDFFAVAAGLMKEHADVAVVGASIWDRSKAEKPREARLTPRAAYHGCGHVIRLAAYVYTRGYLPLPVAYGMEETDIALQLSGAGWRIVESGELRVIHDTDGRHRDSPEIVAGSVSNIALNAFLNYPVALWGWGGLQVMNYAAYCMRGGRRAGLADGFRRIARDCYDNRARRRPLAASTVLNFLRLRRRGELSTIEYWLLVAPRGVASRMRLAVYRLLGMKMGTGNRMEGGGRVRCCAQIEIGSGNAFTQGAWLWPLSAGYDGIRIRIGNGNYFNRGLMIDACGLVEIGDDNMVGPDVYITDSNHQTGGALRPYDTPMEAGRVRIGNRCWIGAKAVILKDVELGDGCVVAAGAVVTESVAAGARVGGVPARPIK
ncbi:MAG: glycosyltransferase [Pseudolabrys sp.]|nr:glycosyltransferase [Pseudolabrys sp.]